MRSGIKIIKIKCDTNITCVFMGI